MAQRRSGQIVSKGKDRWLVRIFLGRDKVTGRRIYDAEIVDGNKGDAQRFLNNKLSSKDKGQLVRKTSISLKEYLEKWLDTIVKIRVREATWESYKYHLEHYLFEDLGAHKLAKLTTFDIQSFVNKMSERYSPRTVQYTFTILKNALNKAVETRQIGHNPCGFVALPKRKKREIKVFSPEQAQKFLAFAEDDKHGLIFEFALITGARPEEYLALKWSDLELTRKTATFQRTLIWRKGGGWYFDEEMKTSHSRRTIPLPEMLLSKLKKHRIQQAEQMMLLGAAYERNDLVFANEIGAPLHYGNLTKRNFQSILKKAGLGHHRLYSLRHSCATLLLAKGVNIKVIQERLGHADVNLTLSTYSHVLEGMQAQASDEFADMFYRRKSSNN